MEGRTVSREMERRGFKPMTKKRSVVKENHRKVTLLSTTYKIYASMLDSE